MGWRDEILKEFAPQVARLTLAADPDGLLTEEGVLEGIRQRGFDLIEFADPVAFRFAYESRYRSRWDRGELTDLVVVLRSPAADLRALPYDLLQAGRRTAFNLGDLFPNLSYPVVASLDRADLDALYRAREEHKPGTLGDNGTKEFILRHVFGVAPELIKQPVDLLRLLLRRHYRGQRVPRAIDERLLVLLRQNDLLAGWPLEQIVPDREAFLAFLQERWPIFLERVATGDLPPLHDRGAGSGLEYPGPASLPFDDGDVRAYVDTLFADGLLRPVSYRRASALAGQWVAVGLRSDPAADRARRLERLVKSAEETLPGPGAKHQEWLAYAQRWAELIALLHEGADGAGRLPALQGGDGAGRLPALQGEDGAGGLPALQGEDGAGKLAALQGEDGAGRLPALQGEDGAGSLPALQGENGAGRLPALQGEDGAGRLPALQGEDGAGGLPALQGEDGAGGLPALQERVDRAFLAWVQARYAGLHNQPVPPPAMLHHLPRVLGAELESSVQKKVALIVVDGLALDQWVVLRQALACQRPALRLREGAVFAWLPTVTPVSRQSIFAGRPPLYYPASVQTNDKEGALWAQFWADRGLGPAEVAYARGLGEAGDLAKVEEMLSKPKVRAVGLVVDKVDKIMHGMELGTAGMHNQVRQWAEEGLAAALLDLLLGHGFGVYLTSDHGNVEAVGCGSPAEGAVADLRGARARVYPDATLRAQVKAHFPGAIEWPPVGLPEGYLPLLAAGRSAFAAMGQRVVAHGGISVEELIVPFIRIEARRR